MFRLSHSEDASPLKVGRERFRSIQQESLCGLLNNPETNDTFLIIAFLSDLIQLESHL